MSGQIYRKLKFILLEDIPADAELIEYELRKYFKDISKKTDDLEEYTSLLKTFSKDKRM